MDWMMMRIARVMMMMIMIAVCVVFKDRENVHDDPYSHLPSYHASVVIEL